MGAKSSKIRLFYRKALHKGKTPRAPTATTMLLSSAVSRVGSRARLLQNVEQNEQQEMKEINDGNGVGQQEEEQLIEGEEQLMHLSHWRDCDAQNKKNNSDGTSNNKTNSDWEDAVIIDGCGQAAAQALAEVEAMHMEMDTTLSALRAQLERLECENRRKLQYCANKWRQFLLFDSNAQSARSQKNRKRLDSMTEECRLRNALLTDKFRNCTEYLHGFDALIRTIQREQQRRTDSDDDDFLREFLLKTAKRQQRKGQLSQAVDTFCQLLIATDGRLRCEEMAILAEVCREKVEQTREFHERISRVVQQQMDSSPYVVDELWGSVLEELRAECADAYEIVMRVRPDEWEQKQQLEDWQKRKIENEWRKIDSANNENAVIEKDEEEDEDKQEKRQTVEQLKYLLGSTICSLWLQITPYGHEEFDEIKELFFRTLDQYMNTLRLDTFDDDGGMHFKNRNNSNCSVTDEQQKEGMRGLEQTVRELLGQYPNLAGTKKMRKIAQRLFCAGSALSRESHKQQSNERREHWRASQKTAQRIVTERILVEY